MDNLWPIIDNIKPTDDVIPFFDFTIESLKKNYEGKINAQICQIEYILKNINSSLSTISNLARMVGPLAVKEHYEEKKDIEKDREQAYILNRDYKYEIFNDHLYYKLFTINIPEFYPVKMHVSAGILGREDVEIEINDIDKLKNVFSQIVNSEKVRMIIMKMKGKQ